ncbi:MAG: DNA-processing protein DprA [Clostridia bacterium]
MIYIKINVYDDKNKELNMFSKTALKIYCMKKTGIIKSNANFWKDYNCKEKIDAFDIDTSNDKTFLENANYSLICAFDKDFIQVPESIKNSEKPFLFIYKGNIKLTTQLQNNVAVIGVLNPTEDIIQREKEIIIELCKNDITIVSGLALGCDSVAHKTCLQCDGNTIAILPTTLENIFPKENKELVENLINNNGLVLTEYINEPKSKFERIKRFIERDRLQAMLSNAVVLIASFIQGKGDSGSRHAMQKAKEYSKKRFVMFNAETDKGKDIFELNEKLNIENVSIFSKKTIKDMISKK